MVISRPQHIVRRYVNRVYVYKHITTTIVGFDFNLQSIVINYSREIRGGSIILNYLHEDIIDASDRSIMRIEHELRTYYNYDEGYCFSYRRFYL